jgi:predicted glycogen debranching enzyme
VTDAAPIIRRVGWSRGEPASAMLSREWLVTNGLGGYAAGTVAGAATRRFHGVLIAALPAPLGRHLALAGLEETLWLEPDVSERLSGSAPFGGPVHTPADSLREFALEDGLPVWTWQVGSVRLEKRLLMPHLRNSVHVMYAVRDAPGVITLELLPRFNVRPHEGSVETLHARCPDRPVDRPSFPYDVEESVRGIEVRAESVPPIRLALVGPRPVRLLRADDVVELLYAVERERGYDFRGPVASPGHWDVLLEPGDVITVVISMQSWDELAAIDPAEARAAELRRRRSLIERAHPALRTGLGAELVLAADQFVISPHARVADEAGLHAEGREARSVIAGYHWFTDWGRDTMISLEGLALLTGGPQDAASILHTFARHVRDGLIPNYFPEGKQDAVYHTADASLWFLHAIGRYERLTGDVTLRHALAPAIAEIIERHIAGTRFGIGMDPRDGLLRQGAPGYQLTWMDAKVDDWVVTPRRGKAVDINALWYNALRLAEEWARGDGDASASERLGRIASQARDAFNARFWNAPAGYCFDVVDVEGRDGVDDASLRPNQLLAIALPHPVLAAERWRPVLDAVRGALLTPVGVRTLAPGDPQYRARYDGDLRARDAAYHQGTAWGWLLGPLVDAWRRVDGEDPESLSWIIEGVATTLSEACLGQASEIFDAEAPYAPRGCVAQAWSVAELIRCLVTIAPS